MELEEKTLMIHSNGEHEIIAENNEDSEDMAERIVPVEHSRRQAALTILRIIFGLAFFAGVISLITILAIFNSFEAIKTTFIAELGVAFLAGAAGIIIE